MDVSLELDQELQIIMLHRAATWTPPMAASRAVQQIENITLHEVLEARMDAGAMAAWRQLAPGT